MKQSKIDLCNDVVSEYTYAVIALDIFNRHLFDYPVVDIGGNNFKYRRLFFNKKFTMIDICLDGVDISNLPKGTYAMIGRRGFPTLRPRNFDKSIAIALFSLTIYDQYTMPDIFKVLIKAPHLYITMSAETEKDLEAFEHYYDAYGHVDCLYTRRDDGLKLMHYWR